MNQRHPIRKFVRLFGRRRGMSAVWVVCVVPALAGFAALIVDGGYLYVVREQVQSISDSAARAGVKGLGSVASPPMWFTNAQMVIQNTGNFTATASSAVTVSQVTSHPEPASTTSYVAQGYWDGTNFYYSPDSGTTWYLDGTNTSSSPVGATLNSVKVNFAVGGTHKFFTGLLGGTVNSTVHVYSIAKPKPVVSSYSATAPPVSDIFFAGVPDITPFMLFKKFGSLTNLSNPISAAQTTINLVPGTLVSTGIANNDVLLIDSEKMQVTAGAGTTTLTVTRGYGGTTAASHLGVSLVPAGSTNTTLTNAGGINTNSTWPINTTAPGNMVNSQYILIDSEIMQVSGNPPPSGGGTMGVSRAQNGTTGAAHSFGAVVNNAFPAGVNDLNSPGNWDGFYTVTNANLQYGGGAYTYPQGTSYLFPFSSYSKSDGAGTTTQYDQMPFGSNTTPASWKGPTYPFFLPLATGNTVGYQVDIGGSTIGNHYIIPPGWKLESPTQTDQNLSGSGTSGTYIPWPNHASNPALSTSGSGYSSSLLTPFTSAGYTVQSDGGTQYLFVSPAGWVYALANTTSSNYNNNGSSAEVVGYNPAKPADIFQYVYDKSLGTWWATQGTWAIILPDGSEFGRDPLSSYGYDGNQQIIKSGQGMGFLAASKITAGNLPASGFVYNAGPTVSTQSGTQNPYKDGANDDFYSVLNRQFSGGEYVDRIDMLSASGAAPIYASSFGIGATLPAAGQPMTFTTSGTMNDDSSSSFPLPTSNGNGDPVNSDNFTDGATWAGVSNVRLPDLMYPETNQIAGVGAEGLSLEGVFLGGADTSAKWYTPPSPAYYSPTVSLNGQLIDLGNGTGTVVLGTPGNTTIYAAGKYYPAYNSFPFSTGNGNGIVGNGNTGSSINSTLNAPLPSGQAYYTSSPGTQSYPIAAAGNGISNLSPQLQQVFYIGDGTGMTAGTPFTVTVPANATRLYIGVHSGISSTEQIYQFNTSVTGGFTVTSSTTTNNGAARVH